MSGEICENKIIFNYFIFLILIFMRKDYLEKLKNVLEDDNFLKLDEILELSVTWILSEDELN